MATSIFNLTVPSLTEIATNKVSIFIWKCHFNHFNFNTLADRSILSKDMSTWTVIERIVGQQTQKLFIPTTLKQKLRCEVTKRIGLELLSWIVAFEMINLDGTKLRVLIQRTKWTTHGKIDELASVREILRCKELELEEKFQVACFFCVADSVCDLWRKLAIKLQDDLKKTESSTDDWRKCALHFWVPLCASGFDVNSMSTTLAAEELFKKALLFKKFSAAVYFFKSFSKAKREEMLQAFVDGFGRSLARVAWPRDAEFIYYFISKLNDNHLNQLLATPISCYRLLLVLKGDLAYIELLPPVFDRVRRQLRPVDFYQILFKISFGMLYFESDKCKDCFTHFWINGTLECKEYVLSRPMDKWHCFFVLCKFRDFRNMQLMLRDMNAVQRSKVISACIEYYNSEDRWPNLLKCLE